VDSFARLRPVVVIQPRVLDSRVPTVSSILDMQGSDLVEFLCTGGAWASGTDVSVAILVEHGELANGSDMAPAPDRYLYRTEAAATVAGANTVGRVGYRIATGKRYVRVTVTPSATSFASPFGGVPVGRVAFIPTFWNVLSGPITGTIVDTLGFKYANFSFAQGGGTGAKWFASVTLYHGDDSGLSDAALVQSPITDLGSATFGAGTDHSTQRIGYRCNAPGAKRYVRMRVHNPTPGEVGTTYVAANCDLVNFPVNPLNDPGFGVVAVFQTARTQGGAL